MIETPVKEKMGFEKSKTLVRKFNNKRVTATIGGKTCNFRSELEYLWAQYCELRKQQGIIKDWAYEQTTFIFENVTYGSPRYKIDFDILYPDGHFEYEETKGYLQGSDNTKFMRVAKQKPEAKITLVMQRKPSKYNSRLNRAKKYVHRIIYANEIFKQCKGLIQKAN